MFDTDNGQKNEHCIETEFTEEFDHKPLLISIPKIEPICPSATDLIEDTSNVEEFQEQKITSIPLITPHKLKDPVILLERCDKIWETLKVIKNVQGTTKIDTSNASETKISKPLYIEYEPVLGNNNAELPNFKFSVKSKKKLFHCTICGKQYTENRRLRHHSDRIHGIYIAPRRYYKGIDKVKEKELNNTEKEEDNSEKVSLKKSENKQLHNTVASLQHVSSSNNNIVVSDLHLKGSKFTNSLVCNNNDININGTMKNEERKLIKEIKQNEKVNSIQHSATSSTCTLCKQFVKDIRKHLVDYHKIESPDFMLKNLNGTCTNLENNKLKRRLSSDENKTSSEIIQKEHNTQNKRQRLSTQHYVRSGTRQCEICLGVYTLSSFYGHVRVHRIRGETKENFHLSRSRHNYYNSPLYSKSKLISVDTSYENTNNYNCSSKNNSNLFKNKGRSEEIVQHAIKDKKISNIKCYERKNKSDDKNICSCGRTFRNPHTLFTHKRICTFLVDANQPVVENNISKKSEENKNSGMGISITIKKRNNSYEIIDKDNKNENKLQDSKNFYTLSNTSKNNNQIELQDDLHETLELSKYSEKHSILKIQSADENIDIDIEEDSQINSYNDNISSSMNKVGNNLCEQQELKPNDEFYRNNVNSKLLKEKKFLTRSNYKKSNGIKRNFARKYNICVCGSKFYTRKALDIHTSKHHHSSKLLCGYCKINFPDIVTWNEHQCSVNEGKQFIALPMQIKCYWCNEILSTYKKFDEHVTRRHFDSIVPFQCFQCDKRFSTTTNRKIHFDAEHGLTICSTCNNQYYDNMKSRHEAYHYGLGFPCHLCKRTYSSKGSLLRHRRNIHGNKYIYSIDRIPDLYGKSQLEFLIYMRKMRLSKESCSLIYE
ncbi:zinc finger protein 236-like isoform X2 [Frieseomelitta varia]|uniref:zinc finger protein 236-like isoform X2 n=1 Tax=Frieseomelitta varia TaxID=561572 RepID=UPI001CB6A9EC|nr:zinc finger protein 236-like isoform X2 [Frieseomelitta varia]